MTKILQLTDSLIIGKGRDRICYEHPDQQDLCIKISFTSDKQSKREVRYFSFLRRKNVDLSMISTFAGQVKTNKGEGYIFDLIRDSDGQVSKTLRQNLESEEFSLQYIRPKLNALKEYLSNNKICVRDISPSNICCQKTPNGINLYIIDGVSNPTVNPLNIRFQCLVNAAIDKSWKGLDRKLSRIKESLRL